MEGEVMDLRKNEMEGEVMDLRSFRQVSKLLI